MLRSLQGTSVLHFSFIIARIFHAIIYFYDNFHDYIYIYNCFSRLHLFLRLFFTQLPFEFNIFAALLREGMNSLLP
jgi:E3 ubiquitin-protein ligase DOA10